VVAVTNFLYRLVAPRVPQREAAATTYRARPVGFTRQVRTLREDLNGPSHVEEGEGERGDGEASREQLEGFLFANSQKCNCVTHSTVS
jgi:hypothetical protein